MDEARARARLQSRLGRRSVDSYLSNLRRIEAVLGLDLDGAPLSEPDIGRIGRRRLTGGMPEKSVRNCLSALRAYALVRMDSAEQVTDLSPTASGPAQPFANPDRASNSSTSAELLDQQTTVGLMRLQAQVIGELRRRGVLRTNNNPVGDFAEHLFARAMGWTLSGNSTGGYDACCAQGTRYQIKARRLTEANGSRQLGAIRKLGDHQFDHLAAILFSADFNILRAVIIPHAVVAAYAKPHRTPTVGD